MIYRPKFKAKYSVVPVEKEGFFLISEDEKHVLEGEFLQHIVPLIDGKNTQQDIIRSVQPRVKEEDAITAMNVLLSNGHIVNGDTVPDNEFFWTELGLDSVGVKFLAANTNILVKTLGNVDSEPFEKNLRSFGMGPDPVKPPSLVVVLTDDYGHPELNALNKEFLAYGRTWMLIKPSGLKIWLGPLFMPGKTACWTCLEKRLVHNREVEAYVERATGKKCGYPSSRISQVEDIASSIASVQLVKCLAMSTNPILESRILTIDVLSLDYQFHYIVKRPQCTACGDPSILKNGVKPILLGVRSHDETHTNVLRREVPEITFSSYAHHISNITGLVKGVFPSQWHGIGPIRGYIAGHNFALSNDGLFFLKDSLRINSSGKGLTDADARTSALCEALERYSGLYSGEEPCVEKSCRKLGDDAVDPRTVMLFSEKQYRQRDKWLERNSRFQIVPKPFDEDAEISWSPVWSLTEKRTKYLPTSYLYYGFKNTEETFYCWADSNGNAAGVSLEDAMLQGFLELIERDSVCIWWYNMIQRPQVDLESLNDPYIAELQTFYKQFAREFWVLDITADTGIPAFAAINRRVAGPTEDIMLGFGAHVDARYAINRALTEMNQFMPAVLNPNINTETQYAFNDNDAISWWRTARLEQLPYLRPLPGGTVAVDQFPPDNYPDLLSRINACIKTVEDLDYEVLLLDQTRPDVGIPVVKVIVPGFRHFWARFAPGRLFEVPVELGWVKNQTREEDLNPVPMFL